MTPTVVEKEGQPETASTERFARCIAASRQVSWDIDRDVIRGRSFDINDRFLPDSLSKVEELPFLSDTERHFLSQIQGRTYALVFGLVERFINAKILEISKDYWLGDQIALEGLVRFSDEELKHQELFRRIEKLAGEKMPPGYRFAADPNEVARAVLGKSTWAVLLLTLDIELFTQLHYKESIDPDQNLSPLFKDVFLYHWKEESQHAIMDELELKRHDTQTADDERDIAVDEFIELVGAVDEILRGQAKEDSLYFVANCKRAFNEHEILSIQQTVLRAYRWQYIISGAQHPHFQQVLTGLIDDRQLGRIQSALASIG